MSKAAPRVVPTHDSKTLIVDHAAVSAVTITRGDEITLGIALDLDGRFNTTRRRGHPTIVLEATKLGELLTEMAFHGSAASREFVYELEAALRTGHERLLKEGGPK